MNDKDRIRLAEAMGLDVEQLRIAISWGNPSFDPFTDANDDYAVLEWMRKMAMGSPEKYRLDFYAHAMRGMMCWNYRIGNHARAALVVLDDDG